MGVRGEAAKILGAIRDTSAAQPLLAAMKDPKQPDSVRVKAMCGLSNISSESVRGSLLTALASEDSTTRCLSAIVLGSWGDRRVLEPLMEVLRDESVDTAIRARAAKCLGILADTRAIPTLIDVDLKCDDRQLEYSLDSSQVQLARIDTKPFIEMLRHNDVGPRRIAVWVLGELRDSTLVAHLIGCLDDEDAMVQYNAINGLAEIRDERAIAPLIEVIRRTSGTPEDLPPTLYERPMGDATIRKSARGALISLREPAVPALISALTDNEAVIRKTAARVLGTVALGYSPWEVESQVDDETRQMAKESLMNAFESRDLEIVAFAHESFIRSGDSRSESILIRALEQYGYKNMAITFLNSGNPALEDAARTWARVRGYQVTSESGLPYIHWGKQ